MAMFFEDVPQPKSEEDPREEIPSLYRDDFDFARGAFDELQSFDENIPAPEFHPQRPAFTFLAPDDLRRRCEFIPDEAVPGDWIFSLTSDRDQVKRAIDEARKLAGQWPKEQLFWEIHPVMNWLMDRLLVRFGRHEAPVIISSHMTETDTIFLFQGVLSNQRSQPLITEWFGIWVSMDRTWKFLPIREVLEITGFENGLPNPQQASEKLVEIQENIPKAVNAAKQFMEIQRKERGEELGDELRTDMRKLVRWRERSLARISAQESSAVGVRASRLAQERDEINKLFEQRESWLKDTFTAVHLPYIRLTAVFSGN